MLEGICVGCNDGLSDGCDDLLGLSLGAMDGSSVGCKLGV